MVSSFSSRKCGDRSDAIRRKIGCSGEIGAKGQGWEYTREMALEVGESGFASVWLPDHVINAHMNKEVPVLKN
jgi:dimethylsulfone monooxygenase